MSKCTICDHEMTTGASCTVSALHLEGQPFGLSPHRSSARCCDCGVSSGGLHHLGCDMQRCPCCGRQLLMCDCPWEEFARQDDRLEEELSEVDVARMIAVLEAELDRHRKV